ncbi:MAG: CoA transferase [Deltaproteobacteria bacterium]|nr:CoA transferase [Deltaproteobacteria bacterium]
MTHTHHNQQIFSGIRILDFTQVIAGSYGTTIMGDMGAEVVKVESPGGDALRFAGPMYKGESGFFLLNNRNKKSICVDLKNKEGLDIIKELIPHFDCIAENFKPGVMDKLGLGYEEVKKIKETIIYLSVSGYGSNNRYSDRPAYDNMIQCETGLTALNGLPANNMPLRSPLSISDYTAGIYAAFGLASAIYHRKNTGQGQHIDIAMYDALISIMDNSFLIYNFNKAEYQQGKSLYDLGLENTGNRHPGAAPHGYYRTRDGHVAHMSLTNQMWHKLLEIIGQKQLIGHPEYEKLDHRKAKWKEIDQLIEAWTTQHTTEEVIKIFTDHRLPCGKARSIAEVFDDPQSTERGIFKEVEHPTAGRITITNIPVKYSETPAQINKPSPRLGEHNHEILMHDLGYSKEKVDALLDKKILYSCFDNGQGRVATRGQ